MLDLATLRIIWWALLGIIIIGFAIADGFDLGIASMYPLVARNDSEKRVVLNTIAPVWEGNQVWFILAGGASFAAWPTLYAVSFSGLYFAMFIVLCGFILRPVSMKYRSKINNKAWKIIWDILFVLGGAIPAILLGVAVGNVMQGLPFNIDNDFVITYHGHFLELLNPFALWCGLLSLSMFIMQGAQFLAAKTSDAIVKRANRLSKVFSIITVLLFCAGGFFASKIPGFVVTSTVNHNGASNPLFKTVTQINGLWFTNIYQHHLFWLAPIAAFLGALIVFALSSSKMYKLRFIASSISLSGIIATFGLAMFPFLLPSSLHPSISLTVWDTSSGPLTLFTMLLATLIFLPIVLAYTFWVYRILRGKTSTKLHVNSY